MPISPDTLDTLASAGAGALLASVIWFGQQHWTSSRDSKRISILSFVEIRGIYRTAREALRGFDSTPDGRQEHLLARHLLVFCSHKQTLSGVWPGEAAFEEDLIAKVSNLGHSIEKLGLMLSNIADYNATQRKNGELRQRLVDEHGQTEGFQRYRKQSTPTTNAFTVFFIPQQIEYRLKLLRDDSYDATNILRSNFKIKFADVRVEVDVEFAEWDAELAEAEKKAEEKAESEDGAQVE